MFTVNVELVDGTKRSPQFLTQREAVAYAGRMAQDSAVKRSEVRGLDAKDGGPGSGPNPGGGTSSGSKYGGGRSGSESFSLLEKLGDKIEADPNFTDINKVIRENNLSRYEAQELEEMMREVFASRRKK